MRTLRLPLLALPALAALCATAAGAQNLFVNPDLDQDVVGWQLACGTTLTWSAVEDEAGCGGSGSLHATSGDCMGLQGGGGSQCIPVVAGELISATGRVRGATGFAGVAIFYHDTNDCSGPPIDQVTTAPVGATGDWQTVTYDDTVPAGAASAALGFGIVDFAAVDVDVDAGYAGASPLVFRDGFDGNLDGATTPCRWTSTVP